MKTKVITAIIAAAIIIGAGGFYIHHKNEVKTGSNVKQTALYNKKIITNPNSTVLLSKAVNGRDVFETMHNNKILKVDGATLSGVSNFKNSKYFIGFAKSKLGDMECYLGNYDGIIKPLFKSDFKTQIVSITSEFAYLQNNSELVSVNLKTNAITVINSDYIGYEVSKISKDELMITGKNEETKETYMLYNIKTHKTSNIENSSKIEFTTPIKDGFVGISNDNKMYYYDFTTNKITEDTQSIMPKSISNNNSKLLSESFRILQVNHDKITYLCIDGNTGYLVTKNMNKQAKVVANLGTLYNYSKNYLSSLNVLGKGSHKYFLYESNDKKMYSMNLETGATVKIDSSNLSLSSARFTESGNAYVLTNLKDSIRANLPMTMYSYPNSDIYSIDTKTGAVKLISKNRCYFSTENNNLTTIEFMPSRLNQKLKTPIAYNIYFNGKKIIEDAPFISEYDGSFLYQGSNGDFYTLYNGISTKINIGNIYDYSGIMQSITGGPGRNGIFRPNINGYFKDVKDGITTYYNIDNHSLIKVVDSKNPSYEVMGFGININESGSNRVANAGNIDSQKTNLLHFEIINYNQIKCNNEILTRVPASEYIDAITEAIKVKGTKEMASLALFMQNIVTKEVEIDGNAYTKAYSPNDTSIDKTYYIAKDGFIYQYYKKQDGTKVFLPALLIAQY